MGDVVDFNGLTRLDLDPDTMLESTKGVLSEFVIVGRTKDGEEYFASTIGSDAESLWLVERFKKFLLEMHDEDG